MQTRHRSVARPPRLPTRVPESQVVTDVFAADFPTLLSRHRDEIIDGSGVDIEVARERGYASVLGKADLKDEGFAVSQQRPPGIIIPVWTVEGIRAASMYKPDFPRTIEKRVLKYEHVRGTLLRLDVHPRVRVVLPDPRIELWITEGQKKGDALVSRGINAIVLHGVWAFKGKNDLGGKAILADFDAIAWNARRVVVAYDNDVMSNLRVQQALDRLTAILRNRGAEVEWCRMPWMPGQPKVGIDDFLLDHTVDELRIHVRNADLPEPTMFYDQDGCFYRKGTDRQGNPQETRLCNFAMSIVEDIGIDDGDVAERTYTVRMRHMSGEIVTARISALDWNDPKMAQKHLLSAAGPHYIVEQGQFSAVLLAAQKLSEGLTERRTYYTHTGWVTTKEGRFFLLPSGAVGKDGTAPDIHTDITGPGVDMYAGEWPKGDEERERAWRALRAAYGAAKPHIALPILAHIVSAPLAWEMPVDKPMLLHIVGETGTFKTSYATLLLNLFGHFERERPPLTWTSTINALERSAYTLKDCPILIDDFKLSHIRRNDDLVRFIQNYGDRTSRARMKADLTLRRSFPVRGVLFSTGEDVPESEASVLGRMLIVDIGAGDIDRDALTAAQKIAGDLRFVGAKWVAWLARNWDQAVKLCHESYVPTRDRWADELEGVHGRVPVACAQIEIVFDLFTDFLVEEYREDKRGELSRWCDLLEAGLLAAGQAQGRRVQEERAGAAFMEWLTSAIATEQVRLNPLGSKASRWVGGYAAPIIGWYEQSGGVWLASARAWEQFRRSQRSQGEDFHWTMEAVWKQLRSDGTIVGADGRNTTLKKIEGTPVRCLSFREEELGDMVALEKTGVGST